MSKRILVIFTGGTIGSAFKDGYISPDVEKKYRLIEEYRKISPYSLIYSGINSNNNATSDSTYALQIDTIEPYRILSENINGSYLDILIDCVSTYITHGYDGILITHGTDTLQYTSAALGYVFSDVSIPIVLVSSNYILDDERANGLDNFYYAVEFINGGYGRGVFVSYRNGDSTQLVHHATRVLPHAPYDDLVNSVGNLYYGEFTGTGFRINKTSAQRKTPSGSSLEPLRTGNKLSYMSSVMYIRSIPGQSLPKIPPETKAILIESYHSGTINTSDEAIHSFTTEAYSRNVPIFLTGAENRTGYDSVKAFDNLHIHVLPKASPIAMYMKLWLICSSAENKACEDIINEMLKERAYDFIE